MDKKSQLPLQRRVAPLRLLAVRLELPELEVLAREPGVMEVFRITIQYHDARHPDQIATVVKMQAVGPARLSVHYRQPNLKPLILNYSVEMDQFRVFSATLRRLDFDKLDDSPDLPLHGIDLWLIERASGMFHHDVNIAPNHATGVYAQIVTLIRDTLPAAVRVTNEVQE